MNWNQKKKTKRFDHGHFSQIIITLRNNTKLVSTYGVSSLSRIKYLVFEQAIHLSSLLHTHSIGPITNTFHWVHHCQRTSRTLNKIWLIYCFELTQTMQHHNFPNAINLHQTNTYKHQKGKNSINYALLCHLLFSTTQFVFHLKSIHLSENISHSISSYIGCTWTLNVLLACQRILRHGQKKKLTSRLQLLLYPTFVFS